MKQLRNENGNSLVYLLWLLSMCGVIIIIIVNITGVYITKQNASTATQQAALAGTAVLLNATEEAIEEFDNDLIKSILQKADDLKTIAMLVDEKMQELMNVGEGKQSARIQAYNAIIPERLLKYPELKEVFEDKFKSSQLANKLHSEINYILVENGTELENSEIVLSNTNWRIEVKASALFSTITDGKYLDKITKDIPQKGVGPKLAYLRNVY